MKKKKTVIQLLFTINYCEKYQPTTSSPQEANYQKKKKKKSPQGAHQFHLSSIELSNAMGPTYNWVFFNKLTYTVPILFCLLPPFQPIDFRSFSGCVSEPPFLHPRFFHSIRFGFIKNYYFIFVFSFPFLFLASTPIPKGYRMCSIDQLVSIKCIFTLFLICALFVGNYIWLGQQGIQLISYARFEISISS